MARYRATIETPRGREDAFAYLSDFSTTQEWDPGVLYAERLTDPALEAGSEFRLITEFLGRKSDIVYTTIEHDRPNAVTFRGENEAVTSIDRITFDEVDGRTRITYDADLRLKGAKRLADPLLGIAFRRVGDRALAGLLARIVPEQHDAMVPMPGRGLDGRVYELPYDLEGAYNLLIVAFRREQQELVDRWLPWAAGLQHERADLGVYELPVISSAYGPARWFIDGGMGRAIPDPAARSRTITVYTDVGRVVENLGLEGTDTIAVLLVERGGRILARELGEFEQPKAERLAAALAAAAPQREVPA